MLLSKKKLRIGDFLPLLMLLTLFPATALGMILVELFSEQTILGTAKFISFLKYTLPATAILILFFLGLVLWLSMEYDYTRNTNLTEPVETETVNCTLVSLDGGQNWFVATIKQQEGKQDQVKILGPVEEIHPGLLSGLQARIELQEFAETNGRRAFFDKRKTAELLNRAGLAAKNQEVPQSSTST
jgi:hypothetical protein